MAGLALVLVPPLAEFKGRSDLTLADIDQVAAAEAHAEALNAERIERDQRRCIPRG